VNPAPSAWDHLALILAAVILVAAAVFDSYRTLSPIEWGAIATAVGGLGVKGGTGIPRPRAPSAPAAPAPPALP
jgi:hypothetical protein